MVLARRTDSPTPPSRRPGAAAGGRCTAVLPGKRGIANPTLPPHRQSRRAARRRRGGGDSASSMATLALGPGAGSRFGPGLPWVCLGPARRCGRIAAGYAGRDRVGAGEDGPAGGWARGGTRPGGSASSTRARGSTARRAGTGLTFLAPARRRRRKAAFTISHICQGGRPRPSDLIARRPGPGAGQVRTAPLSRRGQ